MWLALLFAANMGAWVHSHASLAPAPTVTQIAAVSPYFTAFWPTLAEFRTTQEVALPNGYVLAVIHADTPVARLDSTLTGDDHAKQQAWGLFVFDGAGRLHLVVDIFPSAAWSDCWAEVQTADESACIVAHTGSTYGQNFGTRKYFYDLRTPRVLNSIVHDRFAVYDLASVGNAIYFLVQTGVLHAVPGFDEATIIVKLPSVDRAEDAIAYEATELIDGRAIPVFLRALSYNGSLVLQTDEADYILADDAWSITENARPTLTEPLLAADFGMQTYGIAMTRQRLEDWELQTPNGRYLVVPGQHIPSSIYRLSPPRTAVLFPLPQPDVETLTRYRQQLITDAGVHADHFEIRTGIGAVQQSGNLIWFGTSSSDGEGLTGVGAIGYFDTAQETYTLINDSTLAGWSCEAILVEQDCVWVGLVRHPEGASYSGGLARYDRETAAVTVYNVPAVINAIRRYDGCLFVATDDGIYVLSDSALLHIAFDFDVSGRYVTEVRTPDQEPARPRSHARY